MFPRPEPQDEIQQSSRVPLPGLQRQPYVTWVLLGINLVLWLLTEAAGGSTDPDVLLDFGAMEGGRIASGDYWRLFTAMFLHSGLMHLLFNGIGLFIFGQQLEQLYGHSRFIAIYFLAGLAGSVASYSMNISVVQFAIGVGASGAIFGVLGALVAFFVSHRDRLGDMGRQSLTGLLVLAGINLAFGLSTEGVDNYAHIGGFVGGFLIGLAFSPIYQPTYNVFGGVDRVDDANSINRRWWVVPVAVGVLLLGVFIGNGNVGETPFAHIRQAEEYRLQEEFGLALDEIDKAIEIDPEFSTTYLERALILNDMGNTNQALSEAGRAAQLARTPAERQEAIRVLARLSGRGGF